MSELLLQTKFFKPTLRPALIERLPLVERLNDGLGAEPAGFASRLTLVSAPAGFGKTTLLVEWLKGVARPSAWLSLDERDSDLAGFLNYFVAAIRTIFPHAGANTLALIQAPQLPSVQDIIVCLLSDLDDLNEHSDLPPGQRSIWASCLLKPPDPIPVFPALSKYAACRISHTTL